jgi:pyridoxine 5-phosphate synthase
LIARAKRSGARVSLFVDANPDDMALAAQLGADRVELYTEPFAAAWGGPKQAAQLDRFEQTARAALQLGLGVNAGHDLNLDNLAAFARQVPGLSEVSIGHALICDALELGYAGAVAAYLRCLRP